MVDAKGHVAAVAATDVAARLVISFGSSPVSHRWLPRCCHRTRSCFTPQGHFPTLGKGNLTVFGSLPYGYGWRFVPQSGEWYTRALSSWSRPERGHTSSNRVPDLTEVTLMRFVSQHFTRPVQTTFLPHALSTTLTRVGRTLRFRKYMAQPGSTSPWCVFNTGHLGLTWWTSQNPY